MNKGTMVTLKDLAELSGCSINTVSRALRGCSDIGKNTQTKIKQLAREKGYVPNKVPDYMRSGKTNMIGIVVSTVTNPYFTIAIHELSVALQNKNLFPMIVICHNDLFDIDLLYELLSNRVCGIFSLSDVTEEVADYCNKIGLPLLRVGSKPQYDNINAIYADRTQCGQIVASQAVAIGCKRPCYVGCKTVYSDKERYNGFASVLKAAGITAEKYFWNDDEYEKEKFVRQIQENKNDFIFCFNDEIASYVIEELDKINYKDYTIYGIDGLSRFLPICRKINSVGADYKKVSEQCVRVLCNFMNDMPQGVVRECYEVELIKYNQ